MSSSHSSSPSVTPFPHSAARSLVQREEHPSPLRVFRSSHCSPDSTTPFPHETGCAPIVGAGVGPPGSAGSPHHHHHHIAIHSKPARPAEELKQTLHPSARSRRLPSSHAVDSFRPPLILTALRKPESTGERKENRWDQLPHPAHLSMSFELRIVELQAPLSGGLGNSSQHPHSYTYAPVDLAYDVGRPFPPGWSRLIMLVAVAIIEATSDRFVGTMRVVPAFARLPNSLMYCSATRS